MSNTPTETEDQRIARIVQDKLDLALGITGGNTGGYASAEYEDLEQALDDIDPADSDAHIALLNKLVDNQRLQKVATLSAGGYMFMYQEPKGSTKEGWMAGGTQGDRLVDDALASAQAGGPRAKPGLCRLCFTSITQVEGQKPQAEAPAPGVAADECPNAPSRGGPHVMVG